MTEELKVYGQEGKGTHRHRVRRERMISGEFKERINITITTLRRVCDTKEISKSQRQLMKTGGSERIKGRGREQVLPVDEINTRATGMNLKSSGVGHQCNTQ